ncbi:hypothetical protein [Streptomyces sp. NPDC102462]|uniref:hypothetical protein n=1 Tax=Streptomyces sp. NPDC102462 TaxID=3366178 RepID=UPI0037FD157F
MLQTVVCGAMLTGMSAKQHEDDQDPDVQRVRNTRAEITRAEKQLAKLREQLEDDVRAAVTAPVGEKLPYGRVARLARMLGYKDSSMIYTLRDNSLARAGQRFTQSAAEDNKKPSTEEPDGTAPGRTKPTAA